MNIWYTPSDIPADFGGSVVTIGIFDGVHRGHKAILAATVNKARELGIPALALTFDPHPRSVHTPELETNLVTSLDDRLQRLESAGIDIVYVQRYSLQYAQLSAEDFVHRQIVDQLHAQYVIVGEDVRFGAGNTGTGQNLRELGEKYSFGVTIMPDVCSPRGRRWSSTWVRELLAKGRVAEAAHVLGRPHRIRGIVQRGFQRGRELGFPTANLCGNNLGEVPADGVYAGWLVRAIPGTDAVEKLPAAISVGSNPQFGGVERTVEAHALGRADLNLYGREIAVDFIEYLRPMLKFESVEHLLKQMDEDLRTTAEILSVPVAGRIDPAAVTAQ
ncbi:riboflavin biosynthesis protein [Chlamydia trachomatis]|nr:riboflavin biosynthesis protein [Chlamydia trachomatis]